MKSNFSLFRKNKQQQNPPDADDFLSPELEDSSPPVENYHQQQQPSLEQPRKRQLHHQQQDLHHHHHQQQQQQQSGFMGAFGHGAPGPGASGPGSGGQEPSASRYRQQPPPRAADQENEPRHEYPPPRTGGFQTRPPARSSDSRPLGRASDSQGRPPARASDSPPPGRRAVPYAGGAPAPGGSNRSSNGPVIRRSDPQTIPIQKLDKFAAKWAVRGRFINKGEPRTYRNKSGEGKVWSVDLIDSPHPKSCIRCTFFNAGVDKFFNEIQEGHVYRVSRGRLKEKDKRFNQLPHDCELTLGEDAEIVWVAVDDPAIPYSATRTFTKIRTLIKKEKGDSVTVVGVVTARSGPVSITRKMTGEPATKCDVTIVDDSMASVEVSVWGNRCAWAESLDVESNPVVLVEGCRVDEFSGRRLATIGQSNLEVLTSGEEFEQISAWWRSKGKGCQSQGQFQALSRSDWGGGGGGAAPTVTIEEMQKRLAQPDDAAALEDRGLYFVVRGCLAEILKHRPFFYISCPTCKKKVASPETGFDAEDEPGGESGPPAFCDRCNVAVPTPVKQYLMYVRVADATGSVEVTAMTDMGRAVMGGISADELYEIQLQGSNCERTFEDALGQRCRRDYVFRLRVKSETYRDETKLRYQVVGLQPLSGYDSRSELDGPWGLATARKQIIKEGAEVVKFVNTFLRQE